MRERTRAWTAGTPGDLANIDARTAHSYTATHPRDSNYTFICISIDQFGRAAPLEIVGAYWLCNQKFVEISTLCLV